MASKKYIFLLGILCLIMSSAYSQVGIRGYEDSSMIPGKRMPQHTEFMKGAYNFPAKPRNMWEVGASIGAFTVSGDVPSKLLTPGFTVHVRKAFGYIFSMRLQYMYGIAKGQHWRATENYAKNSAWTSNQYSAPRTLPNGPGGSLINVSTRTGLPNTPFEQIYYNYKAKVQDLSLQGIVTLNQLRFHKSNTGFTVYGIAGVGATIYDTRVNARNAAGKYDYTTTAQGTYKTRKTTLKAIKALQDKSYETPAENQGIRRPKLFGQTLKPSATVGFGMAFKLSKRVNLSLEDRHTFTKDDLLDGQRWQEHAYGDAVLTRDFDSYNNFSVGLNFNIGAKSTEPLWWLNPLDYAYQEVRNPKLMNIPKPVLPDADADGVTDQFDQEQTPAGCPVDSHGVSLDTDGDGVPDCKDKQKVTPTECQPVDADGIGKCPDPECCKNIVAGPGACCTALGDLPSVSFAGKTVKLSDDAKTVLATVAAKMRNNADCKVAVVGYCSSDKREQQLSWDRVNAVISYLVEKEGVSDTRFIFQYGAEGGDCNTVDLKCGDGIEGPNTVPAPHPNLRKN
jgi:outer membrane protein OmpA-like peptidoglycan-associated protein